MKLPFHGAQVCGGVLFAAKGRAIHSFQLADGSHVSSWRYTGPAKDEGKQQATDKLVIDISENSTPAPSQDEQGPPAKRVRLEDGGAAPSEPTADEQVDVKPTDGEAETQANGQKKGKKNKKILARTGHSSQPSERPMVIMMTATKDGSHLVAVTSDKSIWVFEHDGEGHLKQLSCRYVGSHNHWPCSTLLCKYYQEALSPLSMLCPSPCVSQCTLDMPTTHINDHQLTRLTEPCPSVPAP